MAMIAKNRTKSTWTPLSNEDTNNKIFEERKALMGKWFDKWTDEQRKKIFEDLVQRSKHKQLHYARDLLNEKVPAFHEDFTRVLPRVLSIYILSFLDPRTLCRSARVCWYWKHLSESDKLWMPKCLRLGWILSFTPSPYETGVWKRNYVENLRLLKVHRPSPSTLEQLEKLKLDLEKDYRVPKNKTKKKEKTPWRGSDPVPKDTWRYNVLENDDVVQSVSKIRKRMTCGTEADIVSKNARSKVKTGNNVLNMSTRRSLSASVPRLNTGFTENDGYGRPQWAKNMTGAPNVSFDPGVETVKRPGPVSPPTKAKNTHPISARSGRDPPSARLFPEKPWNVPTDSDDDL
ncbi:F-box only protein 16-like [Argopecten irradians]|uniref:F-box only protein 16-like n=1 Tax=Argopecten irradians TaxID=31199 RepID=UPI0037246E44